MMGEPAEKKEEQQVQLGEAEKYFYWDGDNLRVKVAEIRKIKGIDALADEPVVGIKKIYGEKLLDTIAGRCNKDE
jgi:hypothetical protein